MPRNREIEVKVQKEVLQRRKCGLNVILKKKNEDQSKNSKDNVEKLQIKELLHKLPKLDEIFELHRKIGEGTFSSVYLGSLRQHTSLPETEKKWFAIKHLVPTAHPARIEHELRCLRDMGGKDHVIGVELCLRHLDTIVFVMPYIPHAKFSEYVGDMDTAELRQYMRALMVALRHVHSFGVIHRDVKPSNFLYDRQNRRYLLVDFGLAQRLYPAPPALAPVAAPSAMPRPPLAHANGLRKRPLDEESGAPGAKRVALDLSCARRGPAARPGACASGACACAGAGGVCSACLARPAARAPRAGTQGFRPPEVLLKCPQQTTAVDVWAAGVVLASALMARYPLFRAADDVAALAELADLLGTEPLQRAARAMGRRVVVSAPRVGLCLRKLAARLRGGPARAQCPAEHGAAPCSHCRLPAPECLCKEHARKAEDWRAGVYVAGFPDCAFALAAALLEPDPQRRLSAAGALQHPFLADPALETGPAPGPR